MPANAEITLTGEFASTMQQLVAEAQKAIAPDDRAHDAHGGVNPEEFRAQFVALNERMTGFEGAMSSGLENVATARGPEAARFAEQLERMNEQLAALCNTETVNSRLFNSLHQELKSYRDNFLRDSLQKPFIRDLVILFDDLSALATQMRNVGSASKSSKSASSQWCDNLENSIHSLVEVLRRMEVDEIEQKEMVDRAIHRVVTYEPADFAEDDGRIVMRVKRGFLWRGQVLRPEEVVAKRFG